MQTKGLEFFYASDLEDYGLTEDGEPFIGHVFRVTAEDANGNRWTHSSHFPGVAVIDSEWGRGFKDIRPQAIAAAERLVTRCKAAPVLNPMHWNEDRPAYGSAAYLAYGMADDLAWEREQG